MRHSTDNIRNTNLNGHTSDNPNPSSPSLNEDDEGPLLKTPLERWMDRQKKHSSDQYYEKRYHLNLFKKNVLTSVCHRK